MKNRDKEMLRQLKAGDTEFKRLSTVRCQCKGKPALKMRVGPIWLLRCDRCMKASAPRPTVKEAVKAWNNGEPEP